MPQHIVGFIKGTGAAQVISLGFQPDYVNMKGVGTTKLAGINWNRSMLAVPTACEGIKTKVVTDSATTNDATENKLAAGAGISLYRGGARLITADSTILVVDPARDKRSAGTLGDVNRWILNTAANKTGKFNAGVNVSFVGPGSRVAIRDGATGIERWYTITAMSNDGDANDEVTLDALALSGEVTALLGCWTHVGAQAGDVIEDGIKLSETADLNVNNALIWFEAGTWC